MSGLLTGVEQIEANPNVLVKPKFRSVRPPQPRFWTRSTPPTPRMSTYSLPSLSDNHHVVWCDTVLCRGVQELVEKVKSIPKLPPLPKDLFYPFRVYL